MKQKNLWRCQTTTTRNGGDMIMYVRLMDFLGGDFGEVV